VLPYYPASVLLCYHVMYYATQLPYFLAAELLMLLFQRATMLPCYYATMRVDSSLLTSYYFFKGLLTGHCCRKGGYMAIVMGLLTVCSCWSGFVCRLCLLRRCPLTIVDRGLLACKEGYVCRFRGVCWQIMAKRGGCWKGCGLLKGVCWQAMAIEREMLTRCGSLEFLVNTLLL
jgi:hypothetical protein